MSDIDITGLSGDAGEGERSTAQDASARPAIEVDDGTVADGAQREPDGWGADASKSYGTGGEAPVQASDAAPAYTTRKVTLEEYITDFREQALKAWEDMGARCIALYSDGTEREVDWSSVADPSAGYAGAPTVFDVTEALDVADATDQHFWSDDGGAHVTDCERGDWEAAAEGGFSDASDARPYHNLLMNSLGILLRSALKNLVSITRGAIAFFDGHGNGEGNVVASFGSDGAVIGKTSSEAYLSVSPGGICLHSPFHAQDLFAVHAGSEEDYSYDDYLTFGSRDESFGPGSLSAVMGHQCAATGYASFATGHVAAAHGHYSAAFGMYPQASGEGSFACGYTTEASGDYAHAEGRNNKASGADSHVEGGGNEARGGDSHAEGSGTLAAGACSHAEGASTYASGDDSHAEGSGAQASGIAAHAEGYSTAASGNYSHAQNRGTVAAGADQTAIGRYNVRDTTSLLIVGNGTSATARRNALKVDGSGNVTCGTVNGVNVSTLNTTVGSLGTTVSGLQASVAALGDADKASADATLLNNATGELKCYRANGAAMVAGYIKVPTLSQLTTQVASVPGGYRPPCDLRRSYKVDAGEGLADVVLSANGGLYVTNYEAPASLSGKSIHVEFSFPAWS